VAVELYERGTLGLIEEDLPGRRCRLRAFFDHEPALLASATIEEAETRDWTAVARVHWQPLVIGERFFLVPSWRDDPTPPGRLRLEMPPGTASGTGLHPSTQLALEALERTVRRGDFVLDLGCGSGILSAGARLLGAGRVIACDIDAEAALATREYCGPHVAVYVGSARSLRTASFDVVVANINAAALSSLATEIARVVKPAGSIILSGFTSDSIPRLAAVRETLTRTEWVCQIVGL
jgi:ribosomal protein L11 methyltransferase